MTREQVYAEALNAGSMSSYLILELITGYGKSKLSIDLVNNLYKNEELPNILILVAKTVHKQTWIDEIEKWGGVKASNITIECYESLHKYANTKIDIVIADEMQHLSELRLEYLSTIYIGRFIGLSATIKKEMKDYFITRYKARIVTCNLKDAIEDDILPEPTVYLIPLKLDAKECKYKMNKFGNTILTTQRGYYSNLTSLVEYYRKKALNSRNVKLRNLWLSTAGNRLKWLSTQKESFVISLLEKFKNYKTLTFCSSIEQSENLGKHNITSKNKKSTQFLEMFNNNKIKHITACNILNEGVNLVNCRIGIFCNLNSSEIIVRQRIGRLLRHKKPIIIVPYYVNTREEELVEKMVLEYNKESVKVIEDINQIIL